MMIVVGQVRPFEEPFQNKLELTNQALTLVATYGLILFTDFLPSPEAKYKMGWAMIAIIFLILVLNFSVMAFSTLRSMYRKCKRTIKKKKYERAVKQ